MAIVNIEDISEVQIGEDTANLIYKNGNKVKTSLVLAVQCIDDFEEMFNRSFDEDDLTEQDGFTIYKFN